MPNQFGDFCLEWSDGYTGFYAADDVEPTLAGLVHESRAGQNRRGFDGEIKVGRGAGEAVAVEAFGSDTCDGDGPGVDPECAADDGWVAGVVALPHVIAHDGDERCALDVVRVGEETSALRLKAEGAEVVAGDEFAA